MGGTLSWRAGGASGRERRSTRSLSGRKGKKIIPEGRGKFKKQEGPTSTLISYNGAENPGGKTRERGRTFCVKVSARLLIWGSFHVPVPLEEKRGEGMQGGQKKEKGRERVLNDYGPSGFVR